MEAYLNHHDLESTTSFFEAWREYNRVLIQEKTLLKQREKMHWLCDEDLNTKFFYMSTMMRNNNKKIDMLISDDVVEVKYQTDMCKIAKNYFEKLFAGKEKRHDPVLVAIQPTISNKDNDRIFSLVYKEELYKALIHIEILVIRFSMSHGLL